MAFENPHNFFFADEEEDVPAPEEDDFDEGGEKTPPKADRTQKKEKPARKKHVPASKKAEKGEDEPREYSARSSFLLSVFAMPALCVTGGALYIALMMFLPEAAAAVGYLLGWLVTALYLYRGHHRSFVRPLIPCVATLLPASVIAFLWSFLMQTELYSIFDYLLYSHAWANSLFVCVLAHALACFGIYITLPGKKAHKAEKSGMIDKTI